MKCWSELASGIVKPIFPTSMMLISTWIRLFFLFKPALHDVFEFGLNVAEDGQTSQIAQSASLIGQLLGLNNVNLSVNQ